MARRKRNADEDIRALERAAAAGDPMAQARLARMQARGGGSVTWIPGHIVIKAGKRTADKGYNRDVASALRGDIVRAKARLNYAILRNGADSIISQTAARQLEDLKAQLKAHNKLRSRATYTKAMIPAEVAGLWAVNQDQAGWNPDGTPTLLNTWSVTHLPSGFAATSGNREPAYLKALVEHFLIGPGYTFQGKTKKAVSEKWSVNEYLAAFKVSLRAMEREIYLRARDLLLSQRVADPSPYTVEQVRARYQSGLTHHTRMMSHYAADLYRRSPQTFGNVPNNALRALDPKPTDPHPPELPDIEDEAIRGWPHRLQNPLGEALAMGAMSGAAYAATMRILNPGRPIVDYMREALDKAERDYPEEHGYGPKLTTDEINWLGRHGWSSKQIMAMKPDFARSLIAAGAHKKPGHDTEQAMRGTFKIPSTRSAHGRRRGPSLDYVPMSAVQGLWLNRDYKQNPLVEPEAQQVANRMNELAGYLGSPLPADIRQAMLVESRTLAGVLADFAQTKSHDLYPWAEVGNRLYKKALVASKTATHGASMRITRPTGQSMHQTQRLIRPRRGNPKLPKVCSGCKASSKRRGRKAAQVTCRVCGRMVCYHFANLITEAPGGGTSGICSGCSIGHAR